MTDIVDPQDVVLYDIEADLDDPEALIALMDDPDRRWIARRRLAALAVKGIVAATWNPMLHPRGRDGKFIETGGWVRWLHWDGLWHRGRVLAIQPSDGAISVLPDKDAYYNGELPTSFGNSESRKLTSIEPPKAKLNLPDPKDPLDDTPGWKKIGGQGGSNPGGKYEAGNIHGTPGHLTALSWVSISEQYGLTGTTDSNAVQAVGRHTGSGTIYRRGPGPDGLGSSIVDYNGTERSLMHAVASQVVWKTGNKDDLDKTWVDMVAVSRITNEGDEFYIKHAKSKEHAANEMLANRLYELAGVNVADTQMGQDPTLLASRIVPFDESKVDLLKKLDDPETLAKVREDFVVDAWLANWDVVGLNYENIQVVDGEPYRIDAGGALLYRAMGSSKGSMFGPTVGELDTLRDPSINPQGAEVFGPLEKTAAHTKGAERVAAVSPEKIKNLVEDDDNLPDSLADTIIARRAYIIDKYGVEDPFATEFEGAPEPPPPPTAQDLADIDALEKLIAEEEAIEKASKQPPAPAPAPAIANTKPKTHLLWDTTAKAWTGMPADGPIQSEVALKTLFDATLVSTGGGPLADLLDTGAEPLVLGKDGRLKQMKSVGDQILSLDVIDTTPEVLTGFPSSLSLPVFSGEEEGISAQQMEEAYKVWMNVLRSQRVSQEAYVPLSVLFDKPGLPKASVPAGFPEVPSFRSKELTYNDLPDLVDGDLVYSEPEPFKGRLYRVEKEPDASGITVTLKFTDVARNQTLKGTPINPQIAVNDDHGYSKEVLEAIAAGMTMNVTADKADETGAVPLNDPLLDILNKKIEDQIDIADEVPLGDLPPSTALTWTDAFEVAAHVYVGSSVPLSFPGGIYSAMEDEFGAELPGTKVPLEQLKAWLTLKAGITDFSSIEPYLKDKGISTLPVDAPPVATAVDSDVPVPTSIPFLNDKIHSIDSVNFASLPSDGAREAAAEALVGHVVAMVGQNLSVLDDGSIKQAPYHSNLGTAARIGYIESGGADGLVMRTMDGTKVNIPMWSLKDTLSTSQADFHITDITPDDMKLAGTPTFKANGDIVSNGHVVGSWEKVETYHSAWYNEYKFDYTLFSQFSVTGKTMTGRHEKKSGAKVRVSSLIVPTPAVVKPKKSSPAVKKIKTMVEAPPAPKGVYHDGTEAKLGDWVQSTKGGGGFVGKIVGWPNQDVMPGLVFAVSNDGIQKAVKLKTQKKVTGSDVTAPDQLFIAQGTTMVPYGYKDSYLADGQSPIIGQTVAAGKPGGSITTGIITNINPTQGWVYILTPEGKTVSKTFSVTKTINTDPGLVWDTPDVATAAAITTTKPKYGKKVAGGPSYPGPDGEVLDQNEEMKKAWTEGSPKRKLTKDGYAPFIGMRVRTSKGESAVIVELADSWASNPNAAKLYVLDTKDKKTGTVSTMEVDHGAEVLGYDGKPVKKTQSPFLLDTNPSMLQPDLPDGTIIYRSGVNHSYYKEGKYRTTPEWWYIAVQPDGATTRFFKSGTYSSFSAGYSLRHMLQQQAPESFEKVAVVDSTSGTQVKIQPFYSGYGQNFSHSSVAFAEAEVAPVTQVPETAEVVTPVVPTPEPAPEPDVPEAPEPIVEEPVPEPETVPPPLDEEPVVDPIDPTEQPPAVVPQSSLVQLAPPPQPPKAVTTETKPVYPAVPAITKPEGADLDQKPSLLGKTLTLREAAAKMLAQKDSKVPGSGSTYVLGDSDAVEDMAFRYNVEIDSGQENLVLRFKLREDLSEDTLSKMLTSGEGKTGAWKLKGEVYPKQLQVGDAVGVRIASESKLMKPDPAASAPNARVIEPPKLIGKAMFTQKMGAPEDIEVDLYRVKVRTEDGQEGEIDMQHRPNASVHTFEYDPDAPIPLTGKQLTLTPTAGEAGWKHLGKMSVPGSKGSAMVDQTGKANYQGYVIDNMAKGSGGYRMQRVLPDGTRIMLNSAHTTEGGIGFDTTRRANISGEVRVLIPLTPGKPEEEMLASASRAMQAVGIPAEKQVAPSDEQLVNFALQKLITNYHPTYKYRDKPVTGVNDPRVAEALDFMNKHLQAHLGRPVTLEDLRLHTDPTGRMRVTLSTEVAKAMGKSQGNHHFHHHGASGRAADILAGTHDGLMSTDERWSVGVMTTGQSSHADMTIGSGDRIYMRAKQSGGISGSQIVFNPLAVNTSTEVYTMGTSDNYGRRNSSNMHMTHGGHIEYMYKRKFEPEQITFWVASSDSERASIIAELHARGMTHIGSRPVEDVVVTSTMANNAKNFFDIGEDFWKDDIPITTLLPAGATAPVATPIAATG